MKRIWQYIEGVNGLIFILYTVLILSADAFVFAFDSDAMGSLPILLAAIAVGSAIVCPLVLKVLKLPAIKKEDPSALKYESYHYFLFYYLISFAVFLLFYIIYYPGGYTSDVLDQYEQCLRGVYNDWHPVIQTLFTLKLPLLLSGGNIHAIVSFQLLEFCAVLAYALNTVRKYTNRKYAFFMLLFIVLNPHIRNTLLYPWKDTTFAIGTLLLAAFMLHIYFTDGVWLKKYTNLLVFSGTLAVVSLVRHNAILFTAPLLLAALLYATRLKWVLILIAFGVVLCGIKIPLYKAVPTETPGGRVSETVGLPVSVIGAAVANNPEALDEDILQFAYSVAPKETWENKYEYGSFNSIKWLDETNRDVIDEYGAADVVKMMLRCFREAPLESMKGIVELTLPIYSVTDEYLYYEMPYVLENEHGITAHGIPELQQASEEYLTYVLTYLPHLFKLYGVPLLLLLAVMMARCRLNKRKDRKRILIVLSMFVYNFGTMLLLTGPGDSMRFFNYVFLITPIYLIILLRDNSEEHELVMRMEKDLEDQYTLRDLLDAVKERIEEIFEGILDM